MNGYWILNISHGWKKYHSIQQDAVSATNVDVSSMGVSALESHSTSKKHKQVVSDRSKYYSMFFGKSSVSSPNVEKSVENLSETVCNKSELFCHPYGGLLLPV